MAKIESKVLQVHPNDEASVIARMERFGWVLRSNQDVVTKDSHDELIGDTLYSVTETERYTKLMFQRDTEDERYPPYQKGEALHDEIRELERYVQPRKFTFDVWPGMAKWLYAVILIGTLLVGGFIGVAVGDSSVAMLIGWACALVLVVAGILVYRLRVLRPKELARHNELEADKLQSRALLEEKRAEFAALGL